MLELIAALAGVGRFDTSSAGACLKTIKSQFLHELKSSLSNYADDLKQFKCVLGKLTGAIKMSAGANRRIILRFREGLKNPTLI